MPKLVDLLGADVLRQIAPTYARSEKSLLRQQAIISQTGPALPKSMAEGAITTPLRLAHFLAQIAHESDGFATSEEYASGAAYEGRVDLGNILPGDGERFKGRGLIQLTGRENYRAAGLALNLDLLGSPSMASEDLSVSLRIAVWFWNSRNLSPTADRDDVVAITRRINGGINGLASRRAYLAKAKAVIAALEASLLLKEAGTPPTVYRGSDKEDAVLLLQEHLRAVGWTIAVDGDFGPATELAVRQFQTSHPGLKVDGIVGPKTWRALLALRGTA